MRRIRHLQALDLRFILGAKPSDHAFLEVLYQLIITPPQLALGHDTSERLPVIERARGVVWRGE